MKSLRKILIALLVASLTLTLVPVSTFAEEGEIDLAIQNDVESSFDEELLIEDELTEDEPIEDEPVEQDFFYRLLSDEEYEEKEELQRDYMELQGASENTDYAENEIFTLCDTEEEAVEIAKAYEEATGYTVTLKKYYYGVATYILSGDKKASENRVEYALSLAKDVNNNLPAVYPNYVRYACSVSNTEHFSDPFLDENSDYYQWYHNTINDKYIWKKYSENTNASKKPVTVAVLDTGINAVKYNGVITDYHADFYDADNYTIVDSRSTTVYTADERNSGITDNEGNPLINDDDLTIMDYQGHGTNVSGIIGSAANEIGGRGVASGVKILSVKVLNHAGLGYADETDRGLNYILSNYTDDIKVINMSLGGPFYCGADQKLISKLRNEKDITVIVAAGNDNTTSPFYPACYSDVLCVAAVTDSYEKTDFSNYGNQIDISAPGGGIRTNQAPLYSTGIAGMGKEVEGQYYVGMEGTSQATPVVSGVAALLAMYTDYDTPDEIEKRIMDTARPVTGKGLGAGCVDALAAFEGVEIPTGSSEDHPKMSAPSMDVTILDENGTELDDNSSISFDDDIIVKIADAKYSEDTKFYYTLNGKVPDPAKMEATGTKLADTVITDDENIKTISLKDVNATKVTVKVLPVLYKNKGNVRSITLNNSIKKVKQIKISCKNASIGSDGAYHVAVGKTLQFTAEALPTYAKNRTLEWSSSDSSIATVSSTGLVKALIELPQATELVIKAKSADPEVNVSTSVKVVIEPLTKIIDIKASQSIIDLVIGEDGTAESQIETKNSGIILYPESASRTFAFSSSNPDVAKVDASGKITAYKSGTAIVTVATTDGSGLKDTIKVNVTTPVHDAELVADLPSGEMDGKTIYYAEPGQSFTVTPKFNNGKSMPDGIKLYWNMSEQNLVTPAASMDDKSLNICRINVKSDIQFSQSGIHGFDVSAYDNPEKSGDPVAVVFIRLDHDCAPDHIEYAQNSHTGYSGLSIAEEFDILHKEVLDLGNDVPFGYYVYPQMGIDKEVCQRVSFKSSNPKIMTVDENGHCKAMGKGKVTITLSTYNNKTLNFVFTVVDVFKDVDRTYGLKSDNDVEVFYPGKTVKYHLISNKGNVESIFSANKRNMLIEPFDENEKSTDRDTLDKLIINGFSVKAKDNISEYKESSLGVYLYYSVYPGYPSEWHIGNRVPIELYPSAVQSVYVAVDDVISTSKTLAIGGTTKLKPHALPDNSCQEYFKYTTSNSKVAKVYTDGTVKAVSNGAAKITVTAGDGSGKKTVFNIKVAQPVTSVSISSKNGQTRLGEGKKLQLTATVNSDAANKKVNWSLKDENDAKYASVDKNGNVTAAKLGDDEDSHDVIIVARPQDGSNVSDEKTITIVPLVTEIKSEFKKLELYTSQKGDCNKQLQFDVSVKSKDKNLGMKDNLNISSSNVNVATVGWNGDSYVEVTAVSPGKATVTIAANEGSGKSVKIEVTVKTRVQSIEIKEKASRNAIYPGGSLNMIATVNEGALKQVEWHIDTSNLHDDSYWSSDSHKKKPLVDNEDYIKIDPKTGKLTVDKKIKVDRGVIPQGAETYKNRQTMGYVEVYATAKDGSGEESEKYKVYINPQKMTHMAYTNEEVKVTTDSNDSYNYLLYQKIVENGNIEEYNNRFSVISVNKPDIVEVEEIPRVRDDDPDNSIDTGYDTYLKIKGKKAGTAVITVVSCDGAVKKNIKCTVVNLVKTIRVRAKNGERYVVAGSTFNMEAFTNADATNKKVIWSIKEDGAPATIDQNGKVTVKSDYDKNNKTFTVVAKAVDGSGIYNEVSFTVYNKFNKICAYVNNEECTTYTIEKGQSIYIVIRPDAENAIGLFKVFYTKKCGCVEYSTQDSNNVTLGYTKVKVTGTAKGTIPLTIKAGDNSGKTLTFKVEVTD